MHKPIVITGQTGTGKTAYALALAREINGELINSDSRQIYKHLDIVTGKDRAHDIPIWLYDIVDPSENFSSYEYKLAAFDAISQIQKKGKTPIIVGGAYLYLKNLLYGFETDTIPPDWSLRKELESKSITELQDILQTKNVRMFKQLNNSDRNNPRRLMRRIEIVSAKRRGEKDWEIGGVGGEEEKRGRLGEIVDVQKFIGLRFKNTETMREVIQKRVHERIKAGAIEETQNLLKRGYNKTNPGLQTIGYKQIIENLEGETSQDKMIEKWITAELQYAKRQYTFMKKDTQISWLTI